MTSTRAKPLEGLSFGCSATEQSIIKRRRKAGGYVSEQIHEAIRAYCWYRQISQSEFVASLLVAEIEQLSQSKQLTPHILHLYRTSKVH